jgi:hypothetical protein
VRGVELVPFGRIWAVVCEQFEKGSELLVGRTLGPDRDREVRWAGHELAVHLGGVPRGGCVDGATYQTTFVFDNGCLVISSRACQYQWHAHRFPRFLPDS